MKAKIAFKTSDEMFAEFWAGRYAQEFDPMISTHETIKEIFMAGLIAGYSSVRKRFNV